MPYLSLSSSSIIDCTEVNGLFVTAIIQRLAVDIILADTGQRLQRLHECAFASAISFSHKTQQLAVAVLPDSSSAKHAFDLICIFSLLDSQSIQPQVQEQ